MFFKFNDNKLKDIINEIYDLESQGKYHSNSGRTFKINKGFHSVNILELIYISSGADLYYAV